MKADAARAHPTRRRARQRRHHGWLRHLLLAVSLVVVLSSVIGMHQLSVGHEVATTQTSTHAQSGAAGHGHGDGITLPQVEVHHAAGRPTAAAPGGAAGDLCRDCGEHSTAFGSCLLALTLLVLGWLLAPPRLRYVPPSLLPRLARGTVGTALGRIVPPLSLTELSLRRT